MRRVLSLLAISIPLSAQPTIGAFACHANGPNSVWCDWTTNIASDSKLTASGVGGRYSTPVVHPFGVGTGWGVTAHGIALTGLPTNVSPTAYSVTSTSCTSSGCTTSPAVTSGTTPALASSTFHLVPSGPMIRPNDQLDGRNGTLNTGYAKNGDTQFFTWADDGNDYSTCEDCYGVYPGFYSLQHLFKEGPGHITSSELFTSVTNPFSTGSGCPGGSNCVGTKGIISVRGSMYLQVSGRQLTSPVALTSCSWRAGAVTCTVPNSSPPVMTTGMYVTVRSANPSAYNFSGNLTGANSTSISYPLVSDPGPYAGSATVTFLTGCCTNIYKTNDHWATDIVPANNTGPNAVGTHGQAAATWSYMNSSGVSFLISPVQCDGKDYDCTPLAGMDGWVYYTVFGVNDVRSACTILNPAGTAQTVRSNCLVRIRIEDMPITGPVDYWFKALQWYKGTQTGDDGLYDTSWTTNYLDPSIRKLTGIPAFTQAWLLNAGQQSSMTFVGDPFNRFVFAAVSNPCGTGSSCSNGASIYDLGQYPWASDGVPTLVGGFNRDVQRFPYSQPGFPQLVMSSYTKIDSTHASLRVQGSGMGSMNNPSVVGPGTPPNWTQDDYTTWLRDYTMVAGAPPVKPTDLAGADLDYQFDSYTGDVNLYDHSGNNHTATDDNGHPYAFDDLGLFLYGFPGGLSNPVYRGQFRSSTTTTGFAPTYTAMTAYACFGHVPGPPINPVASPEIALSGNLRIARHGTMAAWDVTFNGTFLGAVPIADGKIGCIAVRRNGSNSVTVFTADALRPRGTPGTHAWTKHS